MKKKGRGVTIEDLKMAWECPGRGHRAWHPVRRHLEDPSSLLKYRNRKTKQDCKILMWIPPHFPCGLSKSLLPPAESFEMSSQKKPSYDGGPWKPERHTSQCWCIRIPRNVGFHILHGQHPLYTSKKHMVCRHQYFFGETGTAHVETPTWPLCHWMRAAHVRWRVALLVQNWRGPQCLWPRCLCSPHKQMWFC